MSCSVNEIFVVSTKFLRSLTHTLQKSSFINGAATIIIVDSAFTLYEGNQESVIMEQLPSSSSSARSRATKAIKNPYNKRPVEGKSYHENAINLKKGKSSPDRDNKKVANVSTPPTKSNSNIESYNVVTNTSVIPPRSNNKNNKSTHQSTNNDSIHVNKKLHFDGDNKSSKITMTSSNTSTDTSITSSSSCRTKLELYNINWHDNDQLKYEGKKYDIMTVAVPSIEKSITLILNDSTAAKIKAAFMLLIGHNGVTASKFFLPLPTQRAKLVENFLVLIYNMKSMMVDNIKHEYR